MTASIHFTHTPQATASHSAEKLERRSKILGWIEETQRPSLPTLEQASGLWQQDRAIHLPGLIAAAIPEHEADLRQSARLMKAMLDGTSLTEQLEEDPYQERFDPDFELAASSFEDHDEQGIEKVFFDVWEDDDMIAENLWCKASWLSFDDEDASLRFRFSFGTEGYEDVSADPERQYWSAVLTDLIFPASLAVTEHAQLHTYLQKIMEGEPYAFVERIVYFNAPNGGAQMHHDVERGHEGVVFAQMTGSTFWLAISRKTLEEQVRQYLAREDQDSSQWPALRRAMAADATSLGQLLDDADCDESEALLNHTPEFLAQLVQAGYAHCLHPGDILLLPQRDLASCVWHSVFCLGDQTGEGLSFALRRQPHDDSDRQD